MATNEFLFNQNGTDYDDFLEIKGDPDTDYSAYSIVVVEGAAHGIVPCTACEKSKGQYGNTVKNAFDYMKAWIDKRY